MSADAINLHGVSFAYNTFNQSPPVFRDVSLQVPAGARVVLVGANGAGKSTLLRLIGGRRKPSAGQAHVFGEDAFDHTPLANRVNLVTADWEDDLTLPVQQLIGSAVTASGAEAGRIAQLLATLGIAELLHAQLHALSDGQRRRVQLFCKLLPKRELILLDEATNSLDVLSRASLLAFLRAESEERGCTVIFCTHIFDGLDGWATELAHLDGGRLRHHLPASKLPPGQSLYRVVTGWLTEHASEVREAAIARSLPTVDQLAAALVAANFPAGSAAAADPRPKFVAAVAFDGAREGYAFKSGPMGTGYYLGAGAGQAAAVATATNAFNKAISAEPSGWATLPKRNRPDSPEPPARAPSDEAKVSSGRNDPNPPPTTPQPHNPQTQTQTQQA